MPCLFRECRVAAGGEEGGRGGLRGGWFFRRRVGVDMSIFVSDHAAGSTVKTLRTNQLFAAREENGRNGIAKQVCW